MKAFIETIIRAPLLVAVVCLALTLLAAGGIFRLGFNDGLSHVFASKSKVFEDFVRDRAQFPGDVAGVAVHLQASEFADAEAFEAVREFVLELGLLDGVSQTLSVFSLRRPPDANADTGLLIMANPKTDMERRQALMAAVVHPLSRGRFITPDLAHMLVIVQADSGDVGELGALIDEIEAVGADVLGQGPVTYTVTGMPVLRVSTINMLIRDQMVINVVAALIGFVLCLIAFHGFVPALVAGVPAVTGLIFVLGYLGYSGASINTATNTLPVLILVLGFADSMHLTFESLRRMGQGEDYRQAVRNAFSLTAMPCVLASVTTALAFASLTLSGSELVQELGRAGAVGVLISLVVVLIVNPLLAVLAGRLDLKGWTRGRAAQPLLFPGGVWARVLDGVMVRTRMIVLVLVGVLVMAWGVYAQVAPRYSFLENVPRNSPELMALQEVERLFSPLSSYDVIVPVMPGEQGNVTENGLMTVGRVHEVLANHYGDDRVVSVWSVARWIAPDAPETASPMLNSLAARTGLTEGNGFVSMDGTAMKIVILTDDPGSQAVIAEAAAIEGIAGELTDNIRVGGLLTMAAKVASDMILDLNRSFLVAVAFSGIIIAIWMRSIVIGVMALVVNLLPISLVGAWLSVSGNGLQFTSGLALTIAFGIAVDDTLHALNRLRPAWIGKKELTIGGIRQAFIEVAPVLSATSVILSLGLCATFFSAIPSIAYFGQLSIAVFFLALLADLVLLPALLRMKADRQASH
jgi:predicted RND superfamily exporter protein